MQENKTEQHKPVAWRVHPFDYGIGSKGVYALTTMLEQVQKWERKGWEVEPLYTAPKLSAQPEPEQPKPVAIVKVLEAGGNAGIATRIVEIDDPMQERLQPGTKLYTAPQPAENLRCKSTQKRLATLWGYEKKDLQTDDTALLRQVLDDLRIKYSDEIYKNVSHKKAEEFECDIAALQARLGSQQ